MSIKVVYNVRYGGYGLSQAALRRYNELTGNKMKNWEIARHDPALVQVVEELGKAASGDFADLKIADLGTETKYRIVRYGSGEERVETPNSIEWVRA